MKYQNYSRDELIEELDNFKKMSNAEIRKYNQCHHISVAGRVIELQNILAEKLNIDTNPDYLSNAVNICKDMGINYNISRRYDVTNRDTVTDEYKVVTVALAKGILKNSFEPGKIQEKLYKKGIIGSKDLTEMDINIKVVRTIILDIVGLTPEQYYSIFSTKINRTLHTYDYVRKIIDGCSAEEKEQFGVDNKEIFFGKVFPEYVQEKDDIGNKTFRDYLFASGNFKAGLIKAGKVGKITVKLDDSLEHIFEEIDTVKTSKNGRLIDKKIFDAINASFNVGNIDDKKRMLYMLTNYKTYFCDDHTTNPGFVEVIKARGCYSSPMEFYFCQLSKEDKLELFDLFVEFKSAEKHSDALDMLAEFVHENLEEIERTTTLDDFEYIN